MKSFLIVAVLLLLMVTVLGCGNKTAPTKGKKEHPQRNDLTDVPPPLQYPELYTNEQLPQYNEATLLNTGRQTTSLRDGIRLELESSQPVQTIAQFYEAKLKKSGWNVPKQKLRNETMYKNVCTKGEMKYSLTITKNADEKPITIQISLISK
ncbi:hypothetical protein MNBD_PLANCTO02-612 [hydrothermal vent metagenome]|uniref:Lipoprotein n=1 Tax=hydrothermal vent metagenome TaxID=652676 RepID=A0A3B1DN28_9ZZZZ